MNRRRVVLLCTVMTLILLRWPVAGTDDPAGRRTGEDRTGEQVTLTVNVVCSAKAGRTNRVKASNCSSSSGIVEDTFCGADVRRFARHIVRDAFHAQERHGWQEEGF